MDSITQAALGGLMGELVLGRRLGYKGVLLGLFFGTLPDLDVLLGPFLSEAEKMRNHRGVSHSLIAIALMPFVFGPILSKLHRNISWSRATWFVFLAWATHVLIDCFNTYGTQIFEPFSDRRVMFGNISIIDPLFTLPMLVSLIVVLFLHRESVKRRAWGLGCAVWLMFYMTVSFALKNWADRTFRLELAKRGLEAERTMSGPSLGNIILWRCLAESEGNFHVSYWSIFDRKRPYEIITLPKNQRLVEPLAGASHMDSITWFCQNWYAVIPGHEGQLGIVDMRLGEMTTPEYRAPVFSWVVDENSMKGGAFRGLVSPKVALVNQWARMFGGAPDWDSAKWVWEK